MRFLCMKNFLGENLWLKYFEDMMNKLMGFFELKNMALPAVSWKEYIGNEELRSDLLWTVRSAVFRGNDLNLPRLVGVSADEAKRFADQLKDKLGDNGMVIYYPYFIANKSGTLEIGRDTVVIEAVQKDLWNMVSLSNRDVTIQIFDAQEIVNGDRDFLTIVEKDDLLSNVKEIRRVFRDDLLEGRHILLEWSFAQNCNLEKEPIEEEYLVFYEIRTI